MRASVEKLMTRMRRLSENGTPAVIQSMFMRLSPDLYEDVIIDALEAQANHHKGSGLKCVDSICGIRIVEDTAPSAGGFMLDRDRT